MQKELRIKKNFKSYSRWRDLELWNCCNQWIVLNGDKEVWSGFGFHGFIAWYNLTGEKLDYLCGRHLGKPKNLYYGDAQ